MGRSRPPGQWSASYQKCAEAPTGVGIGGADILTLVRPRRTVHSEPTTPAPMRIDAPIADGPARSGVFDSIESVTWLELFYDLVMVAAIIVFSHGLSAQPTWETALRTVIIFSVLWWVWLITTLLVNADPTTNTLRRGLPVAPPLTVGLFFIGGGHTQIP